MWKRQILNNILHNIFLKIYENIRFSKQINSTWTCIIWYSLTWKNDIHIIRYNHSRFWRLLLYFLLNLILHKIKEKKFQKKKFCQSLPYFYTCYYFLNRHFMIHSSGNHLLAKLFFHIFYIKNTFNYVFLKCLSVLLGSYTFLWMKIFFFISLRTSECDDVII